MNASSKKFLSNLINSISPSGYEGPAAKVWKKEANSFADKSICAGVKKRTTMHKNNVKKYLLNCLAT